MTRQFLQILQFSLDFSWISGRISVPPVSPGSPLRCTFAPRPGENRTPVMRKTGSILGCPGQVSRSGLGVGGRASWILTQQMCSFMPRDPLCLELRMFQDVSRCEFIMNMKKCKQSMGQSNLAKPIKILCNNVTSALENLLGDGRRKKSESHSTWQTKIYKNDKRKV